jgi:hypothetical protein
MYKKNTQIDQNIYIFINNIFNLLIFNFRFLTKLFKYYYFYLEYQFVKLNLKS